MAADQKNSKPSAGEAGPKPGQPDAAGSQAPSGRAGGTPDAYSRRGPSSSEGSRNVSAVYEPHTSHQEAQHAAGITPVTFHELTPDGAQDFHKAVDKAKSAATFGASVELHPADQYKSMRTFVTPDGGGGFALDGDNIVSAFKNPGSPVKGFANSALTLATQLGGRRLDAFDTVLPSMYADAGFRAVARLPFNEQYAPEGWSKELYQKYNGGKPDVVIALRGDALIVVGDGLTIAGLVTAARRIVHVAAAQRGRHILQRTCLPLDKRYPPLRTWGQSVLAGPGRAELG